MKCSITALKLAKLTRESLYVNWILDRLEKREI